MTTNPAIPLAISEKDRTNADVPTYVEGMSNYPEFDKAVKAAEQKYDASGGDMAAAINAYRSALWTHGQPSSADDHGATCADSPVDHYCGNVTAEGDQGTTWRETLAAMTERLRLIRSYHEKYVAESGMTDGCCGECGDLWPCRTAHLGNGWGLGDECYDAGWCEHARVAVER